MLILGSYGGCYWCSGRSGGQTGGCNYGQASNGGHQPRRSTGRGPDNLN